MLRNAFFLFALTLIVLLVFIPSYSRMQDLQHRNDVLKVRIADLEAESKRLVEERRLLLEDPVYREKVAREKMGIVREGEMIYRVVPANTEAGER